MMSASDYLSVEFRLQAVGDDPWEVVVLSDRSSAIRVGRDDAASVMRVAREIDPASDADLRFIAHGPDDLRHLLAHLRGAHHLKSIELDEIASRVKYASEGPWVALLESGGGLGGSTAISVGEYGADPDMYLWIGSALATDEYFTLVAAMRQDIPALLAEVSSR
jgi:hypothetical protein